VDRPGCLAVKKEPKFRHSTQIDTGERLKRYTRAVRLRDTILPKSRFAKWDKSVTQQTHRIKEALTGPGTNV
jgi:hypothetical protein